LIPNKKYSLSVAGFLNVKKGIHMKEMTNDENNPIKRNLTSNLPESKIQVENNIKDNRMNCGIICLFNLGINMLLLNFSNKYAE